MNPTHRRIRPLVLAVVAVVALRVLANARRRAATASSPRAARLLRQCGSTTADTSTPAGPTCAQRARLVSTGERCTVLAHLAEVAIDGLADPVTVALADLERDDADDIDDVDDRADGDLVALEVGREVWFRPASMPGTARLGTVVEIADGGAVKVREESGRHRWANHGDVLAVAGNPAPVIVRAIEQGRPESEVLDETLAKRRQLDAEVDELLAEEPIDDEHRHAQGVLAFITEHRQALADAEGHGCGEDRTAIFQADK